MNPFVAEQLEIDVFVQSFDAVVEIEVRLFLLDDGAVCAWLVDFVGGHGVDLQFLWSNLKLKDVGVTGEENVSRSGLWCGRELLRRFDLYIYRNSSIFVEQRLIALLDHPM